MIVKLLSQRSNDLPLIPDWVWPHAASVPKTTSLTLNRDVVGFVFQRSLVRSSGKALFLPVKSSGTIILMVILQQNKKCGNDCQSLAEKLVITGDLGKPVRWTDRRNIPQRMLNPA